MFRWILNRDWLPIFLISLATLFISSGFELIQLNYLGLSFSISLALSIFLSQRFNWVAIGLLPVTALLIAFSFMPIASLFAITGFITIAAFFASRVQRIWLLITSVVSASIISWILGYQGKFTSSLFGIPADSELVRVNSLLATLVFVTALFFAAYSAGRMMFLRLKHIGTPLDIAHSVIQAGKLMLEIAKQNERLEIAKDLSDLLVQRVSSVVSISEGGRYSVVADPASAQRVLERTHEASRAAQAELRRLYDYLNSAIIGEVESFRISDLEELIVAYRELGYNAVLSEQGTSFALNEGMELCVYKIVFEALNNVRKHAPLGTDIGIDFLWVEDGLQILVKDNGIEVSNRSKRTLGQLVEDYSVQDDLEGLVTEFDGATLSAIRDRAAIYKGRIEATKVPGVGFTLSAIFPNLRSLAIQEI
ncbi:MAG: sensor histidine kinase [Micrococcales bacterium]